VAIEFNCPRCGKFLTTTESRALALAKCPSCSELITVPAVTDHAEVAPTAKAMAPELAATAMWSSALTPSPVAAPPSGLSPDAGPIDGSAPLVPLAPAAPLAPPPPPAPQFASSGTVARAPVDSRASALEPTPLRGCPRCGQPVVFGAAYCGACGAQLIPAPYALVYAGIFRRMLAALIDSSIVAVASIALALVLRDAYWQATFFVWFFYNAALESSREQSTVGKRIFGMIVCGVDGRRLTFARAAIRTLAKLASLAICGMGFVMPLLTPKKQALHDLMTDAVVVMN
jgi:uncharacterized RDD family membrane protein YckC/phage FluMu protein Com